MNYMDIIQQIQAVWMFCHLLTTCENVMCYGRTSMTMLKTYHYY